jgi:light-regulated signal transduction histidine kinase (bacteriophytochrome)
MVTHVEHILKKPEAINEETRLDIFQITLSFPNEPDIRLWCAIHLAPSDTNLIICEFEEYIDSFYNKELRAAQNLPLFPAPAMGFESSPQVLAKSTKSASKPLPVIEIARQRRDKGFTSTDLFNALSQAQKQISGCGSVQEVLEVVVGLTSELTGYHRVMAYRFDAEHNGCVDAELLNPDASPDCFRGKISGVRWSGDFEKRRVVLTNFIIGMHFPASDIPVQARKLYITNRIRLLHDRDAQTARLVSTLAML